VFAAVSLAIGAAIVSETCRAKLPPVAARERLVIQFASCIATTTEGGEMGNINLAVTDVAQTKVFGGHFVAPTFRGGVVSHIHVASQPMLLTSRQAAFFIWRRCRTAACSRSRDADCPA
jgi:hypothetical protein